jgi:hypothetical protein
VLLWRVTVHRTSASWGDAGGLAGGLADALGFGLDGASCWGVTPAGLCNALYASRAVGSARIFAMRSALVAFGGGDSEAVLRTSLRSATLRAFLAPARQSAQSANSAQTHSLDSIVDLVWKQRGGA